jgi:hypothetical protein
MSGSVFRILAASALVAILCSPARAMAAPWPPPIDGPVVLRFAETWRDPAGSARSHGGLDLSALAGSRVRACVGGTVAFAGRVPAADGGTVLAVTMLTADGLRVTLMPLASAEVSGNASVAAGDVVGMLAVSGDGSTSATHLHVSVRRGERQIDPEPFLDLGPSQPPVIGGDVRPTGPPASTPSAPRAPTTAPRGGAALPGAVVAPLAVAAPAASPAPVAASPASSADPVAAATAGLRAAAAVRPRATARELVARPFPTRTAGGAHSRPPGALRLPEPDPALALRAALAVCAALALLRALPHAEAARCSGEAPAGGER